MRATQIVVIAASAVFFFGATFSDSIADTTADLAGNICYKAKSRDAHGIRDIELKLQQVFGQLKTEHYQQRTRLQQWSNELQRYVRAVNQNQHDLNTLESYANSAAVMTSGLQARDRLVNETSALRNQLQQETDPDKSSALTSQIRANESSIEMWNRSLFSDQNFWTAWSSIATRFPNHYARNEPLSIDMARKLNGFAQFNLPRYRANYVKLLDGQEKAKKKFTQALVTYRDSVGRLKTMQRLLDDTMTCLGELKKTAQRRDLVANFKVSCLLPEFDVPVCMHGSTWINFDERGVVTGEAGFGPLCASNTKSRQCVPTPEVRMTGVKGQVSQQALRTVVYYTVPSNKPKKDTGEFHFEGSVTPDGTAQPIAWHGSGTLKTFETKIPKPPELPYVVTCNGSWDTQRALKCWTE